MVVNPQERLRQCDLWQYTHSHSNILQTFFAACFNNADYISNTTRSLRAHSLSISETYRRDSLQLICYIDLCASRANPIKRDSLKTAELWTSGEGPHVSENRLPSDKR
jgi:hypothetical protein